MLYIDWRKNMLYDYKCLSCNHVQEVRHGMTENPEVKCNECGSTNTKKLVSPTATIFKGGGWAKNELAMSKLGVPEHVKQHARDKIF